MYAIKPRSTIDYFNVIPFSLESNSFSFDMRSFLKTSLFSRHVNEIFLRLREDRCREDRHQQHFTVIKNNVIKSMIVNSKSIYMSLWCFFSAFTAIDWAFKPVKKERYFSKVAQES